jgi:hypothetical protein
MLCPSHLPLFHHPNVRWGAQIIRLLTTQFSPSELQICSSTPCFWTPIYIIPSVWEASFTHVQPRPKVTLLYISLFMGFGSRWKGKIFWKEWW